LFLSGAACPFGRFAAFFLKPCSNERGFLFYMVLINQNYLKPTGLPPLNIKGAAQSQTRVAALPTGRQAFFRPERSELTK
jgi:hypothetical protein